MFQWKVVKMRLSIDGRPSRVFVAYRGFGKFAVESETGVVNNNLESEWEPQPSSRDNDFIERTRFSIEKAKKIAKQYLHRNRDCLNIWDELTAEMEKIR